jgi:hypothetical protein
LKWRKILNLIWWKSIKKPLFQRQEMLNYARWKKKKGQKKPTVVSGKSSEKDGQATMLLSEDNVVAAEDENTVAWKNCKAIGNGKCAKTIQVEGGKEYAATAEDQLIKYLHIILDMETGALKEECKEKGIVIKGGGGCN